LKGALGTGGVEGIGVLRCAQGDSKNKQRQRTEADPFGDDNQRGNDKNKRGNGKNK
jgi:hypothetical protein